MAAAPGRTMSAWVWVGVLALARLDAAEDRDARGGSLGLETLFSDPEPPVEPRGGAGPFPVPVWKFVKERGGGVSGFGRPQFRCSSGSLSLRFSLVQHADLRLEDGSRLASLDRCHVSTRTFGSWLLLKFPYASCHIASWRSNSSWVHQVALRYFDHRLQSTISGVATCQSPSAPPPLATCGTSGVTVKLPPGSRLKRVKALGQEGVAGRAMTRTTPGATFVQIPVETNSIFEMTYLDPRGEMTTTLAACRDAAPPSDRVRRPRALEEPDLLELWEFEQISFGPTGPEPTEEEPCETPPVAATQVTLSDSEIYELWGFDEIPDGPFDGETAPPTTQTAPPTTPSTSTVTMTTRSTSAAPTSTTSAATSMTSTDPTSTTSAATSMTSTDPTSTTSTATSTTSAARTSTTSAATSTTSAAPTSTTTTTTSAAPTSTTATTTSAATSTTSAAPTSTTATTTTTSAAPTSTTAATSTTSAAPTSTTATTTTSAAPTSTTSSP